MTFKKTTTLKRKYTLFFFFHSYTLNVSFIQKNKKTIFISKKQKNYFYYFSCITKAQQIFLFIFFLFIFYFLFFIFYFLFFLCYDKTILFKHIFKRVSFAYEKKRFKTYVSNSSAFFIFLFFYLIDL